MKIHTRLLLFSLMGIVSGCSSQPTAPASAKTAVVQRIPPLTRDQVMGPNRAEISIKNKKSKEYVFRNIASAFPDRGKNMMLKDRALPKRSVSSALDNSPWRQRVYHDAERNEENRKRFSNPNSAQTKIPMTQLEAETAAMKPKTESNSPIYPVEITDRSDDAFEPNNEMSQAYDLSHAENRWLALLGPKDQLTEGVQWDEDWYKISVSPHYRRLTIDLRFQHYLGDIDLKLFDSKGKLIGVSQRTGDDEFLYIDLNQGGVYYIQIYGSNRGNHYDLKYMTEFTGGGDDAYEENDTMKTATDLTREEGRWLSEINGEGVAADDDFYKIRISASRPRVIVDLRYEALHGDVDMRLYNEAGRIVASSANIGDDDKIDFTVSQPGTYYIKVYPFAPQNGFNMYDMKWSTQRISQKEASNLLSKSKRSAQASTP